MQAALTSAVMFSVGATMALLMVILSPVNALAPIVSAASLGFLAPFWVQSRQKQPEQTFFAPARVTFWGALAMALTAGIGKVYGGGAPQSGFSIDNVSTGARHAS